MFVVQIFVQHVTLGNRIVLEDTSAASTIAQVKDRLENVVGVHASAQRLLFGGRALEDGRTVNDYNLMDETTLHMLEDRSARAQDGAKSAPQPPVEPAVSADSIGAIALLPPADGLPVVAADPSAPSPAALDAGLRGAEVGQLIPAEPVPADANAAPADEPKKICTLKGLSRILCAALLLGSIAVLAALLVLNQEEPAFEWTASHFSACPQLSLIHI